MKPLDDPDEDTNSFSKKAHNFFESLGVFVLPLFGLIGAFLFPILLVLFIGFLCYIFGLFFN